MKKNDVKFWLTIVKYVATFVAGLLSGNTDLIM